VVLSRRIALFLCLGFLACAPAFASSNEWAQPTAQQLKMTSDPAAPNASAVYLYYEEIVDDKLHLHKVYAEVKILTEKGKEDFNEIEMPYESGEATPEGGNADEQSVNQVRGRTIEPDGTVVPFTGKPYQKQLLKIGGEKLMEKVFSLPDVRVGSVIEYEYTRDYESNWYEPPEFDIQRPYYVHQAHFHFVPAPPEIPILWIDPWGHESTVHNLIYFPALPKERRRCARGWMASTWW
jgi:hypothetical protein